MMVKKQANLHEEQLAQGAKEAGVLVHPIYAASPKVDELTERAQEAYNQRRGDTLPSGVREKEKPALIFIESERFFDARAFAQRFFGVPAVDIKRIEDTPQRPIPRWQVRWFGHASVSNAGLTARARRITGEVPFDENPGYQDLRDIDFKRMREE